MRDFCLKEGQVWPKGLGGTPSTQTPFECPPPPPHKADQSLNISAIKPK